MLVLNPALSQDENEGAREQIRDVIASNGGDFVTEDAWGTRRLAYSIRKTGQTYLEGIYYLMRFKLEPETISNIDRPLRLSDRVLRHMIVKSSLPDEASTEVVEIKDSDPDEASTEVVDIKDSDVTEEQKPQDPDSAGTDGNVEIKE